ncbi:MAG: T9SS type A sorting domain-containing protein [Flavobacteriales bacterium]|jgi:uncharacterized delta-60 repeat protein|nr:T9SS type A sorting domain-containing protein [Flavobacteriales bacterium]
MKRTIPLAILAFSAASPTAFAQIGSLDPTFATAGIGTYQPGNLHDTGYDIVTLNDNSMLVCGVTYHNSKFAAFLTHILEDGSVDAAFGEANGYTYFQAGEETYAYSIVLGLDSSIFLSGTAYPDYTQQTIFLAHTSAMGIPDAAFGTDGAIYLGIGTGDAEIQDMLLQPDGKIVLAGRQGFGSLAQSLFMRYMPDGTLDTTFNGTGISAVDGSNEDENLFGVARLEDGSIVGVGYGLVNFSQHNLLVKLDADGMPDAAFGTAGAINFTAGGINETARDVVAKASSFTVVGSTTPNNSDQDGYISKFNSDGSFDASFGTGGTTINDFGELDLFIGLARQNDGNYVVCGTTGPGGFLGDRSVVAVRYNTDGSLDQTFGDMGKTLTNVGTSFDETDGIAIQPDGKIVASGVTGGVNSGLNNDMIVLRYLVDGMISISNNAATAGEILLFPNPVNGTKTTLNLRNGNGAEVWTSDLQGRTIGSTINVPKGVTSVSLDANGLAAGTYLVNVLSQGNITTLKMQVAK